MFVINSSAQSGWIFAIITAFLLFAPTAHAFELSEKGASIVKMGPIAKPIYKKQAPCKHPVLTQKVRLLNDKSFLKQPIVKSGFALCAPQEPTESPNTHRFHTAATGTQIFGGEGDYPTSDMSFIFLDQHQTITVGESAVFDVEIDWGQRDSSLLMTVDNTTHRANLLVTDNAPTFISNNSSGFQIQVESFVLTQPGEYEIQVSGLAGPSSNYLTPQFIYLTVQPLPSQTEIEDVVDFGGQVTYSPTQLDTTGINVTQPFEGTYVTEEITAIYDGNSNGIVDSSTSPSTSVYPAHINGFGILEFGSQFANTANLVVFARYGTSHFVAIHFNVTNNIATPVLALAGDTSHGVIMLQNVDLVNVEITGSMSSYLTGSIAFDPISYDGVANTTYANHIEFSFTAPIEYQ